MKKILFVMLLLSSVSSFAESSKKNYCTDVSRKVFYTKLNLDFVRGNMDSSAIGYAELIANFPDGTAVIVPCFNNRVLSKEGIATSSLIISQKNIFVPVKGKATNGSRVVGVNYEQATNLVEKTTAFVLKNYILVKSDALLKLKKEKFRRSIDNR